MGPAGRPPPLPPPLPQLAPAEAVGEAACLGAGSPSKARRRCRPCAGAGARARAALREGGLLTRVAGPSVLASTLSFLVFIQVAQRVGARFGDAALASYSLGQLVGNLTGRSVVQGVMMAYGTLGPQAVGRGEHRLAGVLILRAWGLCAALLLPVVASWGWAEPLLVLLGQDPRPAGGEPVGRVPGHLPAAAAFVPLVRGRAPVRFVTGHRLALRSDRAAQRAPGLRRPGPPAGPFRLRGLRLDDILRDGFPDGRGARAVADLRCQRPGPATGAFPGWAGLLEAWHSQGELLSFARLALPGVLSMTEWWFWEVTCFRAGTFGAEQLAAHSLIYMLVPLLFQVPRGIRDGLGSRAGHLLGEGRGEPRPATSRSAPSSSARASSASMPPSRPRGGPSTSRS
ncbi:unnamed protein product [Prorocentrum cordatum]|uniref:Protein RFT1 homolog n=1 Tax=Prorocentrum cordatum TaxID=2364126 RepID=A0ABN9WZ16_9DINO|nr:unnamed protein product [Polarella glacialis]